MDASRFDHAKQVRDAGDPILANLLSPTTLLVWVVSSLVTGLSGPFGTFDMFDTEVRFLFWSGVLAGSIIALFFWRRLMVRIVGPGRNLLFDGAMVFGMTGIVTVLAQCGLHLLRPWQTGPGIALPTLIFYVVACIIAGYTFRRLWPGLEDPRYTLALARVTEPRARIRPELARRLDAPDMVIERLQADGHFIEVVGGMKRQRLRMRLTDAIEEMVPIEGVCAHRSHWVAVEAVTGAERRDGKIMLRMRNGDLVPVSRKYQPDVAAKGLICHLTN